uniref:Uncharacterized protein n=1 Tax=viral metagenome TaxID=1070528 RepID=A0A6C0BN02_9ZZZZ
MSYAPAAQWALYQGPPSDLQDPSHLILTESQSAYQGTPGPCTEVVNLNRPHQAWALNYASQPARMNIDGQYIESNNCAWACDDTGLLQINPSPYVDEALVMPGGVMTAVKMFTPCGANPQCAAQRQAQSYRAPRSRRRQRKMRRRNMQCRRR